MSTPYWVYIGKMSTPLFIRDLNKLVHSLAGITGNQEVSICCGYDVYQVNSKVISKMANNVLLNIPTIIQFSGESYIIETAKDILDFLRRFKAERFYISGDIIKSLVGAIK